MDCTKTTVTVKGVWTFKKCDCLDCKTKKQAAKEFYKRFDKVYAEWKK